MEKSNKQPSIKLVDFLILLFAYIACVSLPFALFIKAEEIVYLLQLLVKVGYIVFLLFYLKKLNLNFNQESHIKDIFILLPCFLVCFSNLTFGYIESSLDFSFNYLILALKILISLSTAVAEELIFRWILFPSFQDKKRTYRIFFVAGIFALAHLVNFLSTFNPADLLQVVYTFGIGLILSLFYEFGGNIFICMAFHFCFNAFNSDLFELAFNGNVDFTYFLVNGLFALVVGIYLSIVYFVFLNKASQK